MRTLPFRLELMSTGAPTCTCVHTPYGGAQYRDARALRERVLRRPLGLPLREIDVRDDAEEELFCAVDGECVVACLQLKPLDSATMKLRQMAVEPRFQNSGVGSALVQFAEGWAREHGIGAIVLDARTAVLPFYEKLGYARKGEPFESVGIPHQKMAKTLRAA